MSTKYNEYELRINKKIDELINEVEACTTEGRLTAIAAAEFAEVLYCVCDDLQCVLDDEDDDWEEE